MKPLHSSPGLHQLKGDVLILANGEDHAGCALRIHPGDDVDSAVRGASDAGSTTSTRTSGERLQVTWRQLERFDVSAFPEMRSGELSSARRLASASASRAPTPADLRRAFPAVR